MPQVLSSRGRLFAAVGVLAVALMGIGAGIVTAVSNGTAGELNYQKKTFTVVGTESGASTESERRVRCIDGRHVTGGGFEDNEQFAGAGEGHPFDGADGDTVPDDGWEVTTSVFGENSGKVTVYAICDN